MIKTIKKHMKLATAIMSAVVLLLGAAVIYAEITQPYAVYADGTKVTDPYVITAGGEELFLVEDQATAEDVITEVMDQYTPEGSQVNSITIDKKIEVLPKKLEKTDEPETVLTRSEAVKTILASNKTDDPMFAVTISAEAGAVKEMQPGVTYITDDSDYEGNETVEREGTSGSQVVTEEKTSVNGNTLTTEEVDKTVIQDGIDKLISKGTKSRPADTVFQDYSGSLMGSGDGQNVVNYAKNFLGNPYRWGGTSLTHGCDCSGFIYALYNHFGVGVPRMGIYKVGKGVCLAEAKAGDVVYYPGHYAMYMGDGKIIHAYNSRVGIVISNVHAPGTILSIRRMID
ncbi:MAG: NlpC/P60 family protein [Bacillota bacterium]|nr:NlpC/P60 family protein [Bacillota bacterium]